MPVLSAYWNCYSAGISTIGPFETTYQADYKKPLITFTWDQVNANFVPMKNTLEAAELDETTRRSAWSQLVFHLQLGTPWELFSCKVKKKQQLISLVLTSESSFLHIRHSFSLSVSGLNRRRDKSEDTIQYRTRLFPSEKDPNMKTTRKYYIGCITMFRNILPFCCVVTIPKMCIILLLLFSSGYSSFGFI